MVKLRSLIALLGACVVAEPEPDVGTVEQAAFLTPKRIPVRIVETHDCEVNVDAGCTPYTDPALLRAAFDRVNDVFDGARIEFWVKSVEYVEAPEFFRFPATPEGQPEPVFTFSSVQTQLRRIFPAMPLGAFSSSTQKSRDGWLNSGATLFGDPDEVLFVLYDRGQSLGQFPEQGRYARASIASFDGDHDGDDTTVNGAGHGGIAAHELGHFFGLRHAWNGVGGTNPETGDAWSRADAYDMHRCFNGSTGFTSAEQAMVTCAGFMVPIETAPDDDGNGGNGGTNGAFVPTITVSGDEYTAADDRFPGMLFDLGGTHAPPTQLRWGVNVMTYYSHFPTATARLDLRVPARMSYTQREFVRTYRDFDQPYDSAARTAHVAGLQTSSNLVANNDQGLRPQLGRHTDDMLWINNGNGTFANRTTPISGTDFAPISADLTGDGLTDLVWYRPSSGIANVWIATGAGQFTHHNNISLGGGAVLYAGNFNGTGGDELIVDKPGATAIMWRWNGGGFTALTSWGSSGWRAITGNFDGANGDDILWYSEAGGNTAIWWSQGGTSFQVAFPVSPGAGYRPFAGDFDGDTRDDVFFYMPGSSLPDRVWYGLASRNFDIRATSVSGTYTPIVGDWDGDGRDDVLWENVDSIIDRVWHGRSTRSTPFDDTGELISIWGEFLGLPGRYDDTGAPMDLFWYER